MGHTDVVPVNPDGWSRDPFSGDLVDGFVWGRGAVDMLNITASQAVAFRRLAESGFTPKGTLIYLAVADEEALGTWGAHWLVEHERDAVYADYVLTESGGYQMPTPERAAPPGADGREGHVLVEDPDQRHARPRVAAVPHRQRARDGGRGRAPHQRRTARRRRSTTSGAGSWRRCTTRRRSATRSSTRAICARHSRELPLGMSRLVHACTHTTFAPTVMHGGHEDQRHPRHGRARGRHPHAARPDAATRRARCCDEALGDLADPVEIESNDDGSTESPIDTPLWDSLSPVTADSSKDSALVPFLMVGGTDNRFFRRAGSVGYGFALFSRRLAFEDYATMFHGNDERVDVESLASLASSCGRQSPRDLLGA